MYVGMKDASALKSVKLAQRQVKERIDELTAALRDLGVMEGGQAKKRDGVDNDDADDDIDQPQVRDIQEDLLELQAQQTALMEQKQRAVKMLVKDFKAWWAACPPPTMQSQPQLQQQVDAKDDDNEGDEQQQQQQISSATSFLPPLVDSSQGAGAVVTNTSKEAQQHHRLGQSLPQFPPTSTTPTPLSSGGEKGSKVERQQKLSSSSFSSATSAAEMAYEMARYQAMESRGSNRRRNKNDDGIAFGKAAPPSSALSKKQKVRSSSTHVC